jgi:hypothetical protein
LHLYLPDTGQVSPSAPDQCPSPNFGTTSSASIWPRQPLRYKTKGSSCQHDIQINDTQLNCGGTHRRSGSRKYELHETLGSALEYLEITGDIRPVLRCYRRLMVQRDVREKRKHQISAHFRATRFLSRDCRGPGPRAKRHTYFTVAKDENLFILQHSVCTYLDILLDSHGLVPGLPSRH